MYIFIKNSPKLYELYVPFLNPAVHKVIFNNQFILSEGGKTIGLAGFTSAMVPEKLEAKYKYQKLQLNRVAKKYFLYFCTVLIKETKIRLTYSVIGNTSDFGSEESKFEP